MHSRRIANITRDEFDVLGNVAEPARTAARIVIEHAHPIARADQLLHQSGADEAAAAGDQDAGLAHGAPPWRDVFGGNIDPSALHVRTLRGVHQLLHATALGKPWRRGAAAFDGVEKFLGEPRHRRNAAVGILRVVRIDHGDAFERRRRPLGVKQFEAAHVIGARIMQHQRAVLAEELDAMTGAKIGRATHGEGNQGSRLELQCHCYGRFQVTFVRQSTNARRQAGDRSAEPLKIVETVTDEIAQHAAAVVTHGFPIAHAQLQGAAFDMPMHDDMAQRADGAGIEHRFGAFPAHDLMEIEIDRGRLSAEFRLSQHGARGVQVAGHRLFDKHRLAEFKCADRDLPLQARRRGDGDRLHARILDQWAPAAVAPSDVGFERKRGRACRVSAGKRHHLATRVGAKRGQLHAASVIGSDNA